MRSYASRFHVLSIALTGAVVGLSVGCSEGHLVGGDDATLGAACELQEDCPPGTVCFEDLCVVDADSGFAPNARRCQVDAECLEPDLCLGGVCRPPGSGAQPPQNGAGSGDAGDEDGTDGGGEEDDDKEADPNDQENPEGGGDPAGNPGPEADPDPNPDPEPAAEPDPIPDPAPDPEPDAEPDAEPGPVACDADRFEPNDAVNVATPVAGDTDEDNLTACDGDTDLFAIELIEGGAFSATARGAAGLRIELIEADGIAVAARSRAMAEGARTGLAAIPAAGRYFVRVTSAAVGVTYRLQITASDPAEDPVGDEGGGGNDPPPDDGQCEDDFWEPNDGFASALPVGPGLIPLLQICDGNPDLFAVDLAVGQTLTASIVFNPDDADLDMALHGPDTALLDLSDGLFFSEEVTAQAVDEGWHFIAVFPYEFVGSAGYLLTINVD